MGKEKRCCICDDNSNNKPFGRYVGLYLVKCPIQHIPTTIVERKALFSWWQLQ